MKALLLAGIMATQFPPEMQGNWQAYLYDDVTGYHWRMHRVPEITEWEIQGTKFQMFDASCIANDFKKLGDLNYEVWATCPGQLDDTKLHYQFTICGDDLYIYLHDPERGEWTPNQGCAVS